jgi:hypothetical protein
MSTIMYDTEERFHFEEARLVEDLLGTFREHGASLKEAFWGIFTLLLQIVSGSDDPVAAANALSKRLEPLIKFQLESKEPPLFNDVIKINPGDRIFNHNVPANRLSETTKFVEDLSRVACEHTEDDLGMACYVVLNLLVDILAQFDERYEIAERVGAWLVLDTKELQVQRQAG